MASTNAKYYGENGIHRVPLWRIAGFAANNLATNMYLFLMGYVAYYLTGFVGVAVVTASSFSMAMRVWDGVTDPFIGYFVDKTNGKFGKNRPFMIIGQIILCVMSFILFHVTHRLPENTAIRFGFFIVISAIYYIGYTFQCVVTKSAQTCLTNDPKQRPLFSIFDGVYNSLLWTIMAVIAAKLSTKYGSFYSVDLFHDLWVIIAIGIFLAVLLARLFSKFLVKGDDTPFVMELPPYRMPTAKSIFRHTWEKGAQYLKKMGGIIMIASIIIWFLGYYPNHEAYETVAEQQENSYIGQLGRAIEPVIKPMGFDWKLGIGLISGVGAKELVVSTLGVLYVDDPEADEASLAERIPITPLVAFCYMLFVLIYFPCIAALAAIKQESGSWKWALFAACYTTGLAWLVAFSVYQIGGMFV